MRIYLDIFKICALAIISVLLILIIQQHMMPITIMITIVTGIIIFMMIIPSLEVVLVSLFDIIKIINIQINQIGIIIKIIGIAYICEFCSQICTDAGQGAIASKIDLSGKVLIMFISVPIITDLLNLITRLLP